MTDPTTGERSYGYGADPASPTEQPTTTRPREAVLRPVPDEFPTPPPRPAGWNRSRPPAPEAGDPPRRRPLLLALVAIAVLALLVLLGASYLLLRALPDAPAPSAATAPAASPAPVMLGEVSVRALSLEEGVASVGDAGSRRDAEGEFVILTLEVRNDSAEPVTLSDSVVLVDEDGAQHGADREASIAHLADSDPYGLVAPGESRVLHAVYDVPVGTSIDRAAIDLSRYPAGGSGELPL